VKSLFENYFGAKKSYTLKKVYAIDNSLLKAGFETRRLNMKRRLEAEFDLFGKKSWSDNHDWRESLLDSLDVRVQKFPHNANTKVYAIPALHGIKDLSVAWKICQTGTAKLAQLDDGFYGMGMYFTSHAEYALDLYSQADAEGLKALLVCWVLVGNSYPCVEFPNKQTSPLFGKPLKPPHDSHFVTVNKNGLPVHPVNGIKDGPVYDEFVIEQESQILPAYVLLVKK